MTTSFAAPIITVVAAALCDGERRWLLQQRLPGKDHAGLWEFPGGKVDPGETPRQALCREWREELALVLDPASLRPLGFAEQGAGEGRAALVLLLYLAEAPGAVPVAQFGQAWRWVTTAEAAALPLAPLDRILLPLLTP